MSFEKFICFDLDGTLSHDHSWELLNTALGMTSAQDAALYDVYKQGSFSYDE